eukprot:scaffold10658_cov101-Skeletonema_marinoi.AAC.8
MLFTIVTNVNGSLEAVPCFMHSTRYDMVDQFDLAASPNWPHQVTYDVVAWLKHTQTARAVKKMRLYFRNQRLWREEKGSISNILGNIRETRLFVGCLLDCGRALVKARTKQTTASAERTLNLREVAANDLSTSDAPPSSSEAAPNHQQTTDKPQCALDVASLNRGDVQIELPGGTVGFETFPNCKTIFSSEFLEELGVDDSTCIMSVAQLTKASFTISRFREYMPKEALDYLEYLKGPLTTGRAGTITCEVSTGQFSKTHAL